MGFFGNMFNKKKSIESTDFNETAESLVVLLKQYIKNENNAYSMAWQILSVTNMNYTVNGMQAFPTADQSPPLLKKFQDKVIEDGMLKEEYHDLSPEFDYHQINFVLDSLTKNISDPELKLKINFAMAESIIREWNLDR